MTVDSDSVTDDQFADLVKRFGEKQAASMVLLLAYSNFQDRFLLCLGAPLEEGGPLPPVAVKFKPESFVMKTTRPPAPVKTPLAKPTGSDLVEDDPEWKSLPYDALQIRLEAQRRKPTRLRVPAWDEVVANLPEGLMKRPSDIVWYRIVFGYAPELAVPFEVVMRTAGSEASSKWDRIFGQSLFWVNTTRAVRSARIAHGPLRDELGSRGSDGTCRKLPIEAGCWQATTGPVSHRPISMRLRSRAS